ncbi:hypothetical protein [Paraflavitalea pollutisoli]|uniref:hypothetical protein n=1 Tax=Paraflavitalea pollutisoli TaxID=3034143 RepID=UPI0023EBF2ED|nr:hypothetical protein [Paraflavitalea sp. H1-2-19X]
MVIMLKKIVIPASNTKAVAFFDALNKTKEEIKKKLTDKSFTSPARDKHEKNGN